MSLLLHQCFGQNHVLACGIKTCSQLLLIAYVADLFVCLVCLVVNGLAHRSTEPDHTVLWLLFLSLSSLNLQSLHTMEGTFKHINFCSKFLLNVYYSRRLHNFLFSKLDSYLQKRTMIKINIWKEKPTKMFKNIQDAKSRSYTLIRKLKLLINLHLSIYSY